MEQKQVIDINKTVRKEPVQIDESEEQLLNVLRIDGDFSIDAAAKHDGILYHYDDKWMQVLRSIRSHEDPGVYLKPFFLLSADQLDLSVTENQLVDGIVYRTSLSVIETSYKKRMAEIHAACRLLRLSAVKSSKCRYPLKVLRFMLTRNCKLQPCMCASPRTGYNYPVVDILTTGPHVQQFSVVEYLRRKNLIEGKFSDVVHQCNACSSAYLNFREVCVKCSSADIALQQLIHHYRCGNMGPEKDYLRGDGMICPKCRKKLGQLGVDYDRPADIYHCNACDHQFQDPDVDVVCFDCGKTGSPETLVNRTFNTYSLTPLGRYSGVNNILYSLQDELEDEIELIDRSRFVQLAQKENERIRRYRKSASCLGLVMFENFHEVIPYLGSRSSGVTRQLIEELKRIVRSCDLISVFSDYCIVFLLVETQEGDAQRVLKRLAKNICKLAGENVSWNLQVTYRVEQLNGKNDIEEDVSAMIVGGNKYACDN